VDPQPVRAEDVRQAPIADHHCVHRRSVQQIKKLEEAPRAWLACRVNDGNVLPQGANRGILGVSLPVRQNTDREASLAQR